MTEPLRVYDILVCVKKGPHIVLDHEIIETRNIDSACESIVRRFEAANVDLFTVVPVELTKEVH